LTQRSPIGPRANDAAGPNIVGSYKIVREGATRRTCKHCSASKLSFTCILARRLFLPPPNKEGDAMFCCREADAPKACCIPVNPRGGREDTSYDGCLPAIRIPGKVLKGASQRKRSPLNRTVHTRWQAAKKSGARGLVLPISHRRSVSARAKCLLHRLEFENPIVSKQGKQGRRK
jgi:hypothetical protein